MANRYKFNITRTATYEEEVYVEIVASSLDEAREYAETVSAGENFAYRQLTEKRTPITYETISIKQKDTIVAA